MHAAEPCQQGGQMRPIFLRNGGELQPHSDSAFDVTNDSGGSELSFFHNEIELRLGSNGLWPASFDKNSSETQIANAQNIAVPLTTPINPHLGCFNP